MSEEFIESSWSKRDEAFETTLRPQLFSEFIGQSHLKERLDIFIGAAKKREEVLGHCLFYGPPGLGKTTLASIIAKAMGVNLIVTSGAAIEKAGDLAGILTNLKQNDLLFIDEIHRLDRTMEEYLYPAMENFCLDLMIDSGPSARSVQVKLPPFTLIGATTRIGLISSPLRSRFPFSCRLDYYDFESLTEIILRSSLILGINIQAQEALEIAVRCRGTPRIANSLLRWVRDYSQMRTGNKIDMMTVRAALAMLAIDDKGLDEMDKKILTILIDHYKGGPVGVQTLAIAIGEESSTISEVYEPYLIMQGFLKRTPRGREATSLAYQHLGRSQPSIMET